MVISLFEETVIRKAKTRHHRTSRPQQTLWSFDLMLTCLITLTITFFILTLYSILQANVDLFNFKSAKWLSIKILDTSSAATLFITLLGALLVRHQFALGILPRINYTSTLTTKQDSRVSSKAFETWRVDIRNTGLGSAIITKTEYFIKTSKKGRVAEPKSFNEIVDELVKLELIRGEDYWMSSITSGFSLSSKDEFLVFEIKTVHLKKLPSIYMNLFFQGQLGDKYCREILLTPRL